MSYLHTKFHDNWISSFRGVAMTRFLGRTDGQTDGVTALLDLLSPSATQVKNSGILLKISPHLSTTLNCLIKNIHKEKQQIKQIFKIDYMYFYSTPPLPRLLDHLSITLKL